MTTHVLNKTKPITLSPLKRLLNHPAIRRVEHDGGTWYAATDLISVLTGSNCAQQHGEDLKAKEPFLRAQTADLLGAEGRPDAFEVLDFEQVMRLVQCLSSPKAQRLQKLLARMARESLEEAENPELLALRARRLYRRKGYSRRWIDKRLRGISARQELTSEWHHRGAQESEQFRALTNELMRSSFGMDVERYRRYKNLSGQRRYLRDHMSGLELALTTLAEMAAVELHRGRNSTSFDRLLEDTKEAGEIVSRTRQDIESRIGRSIVQEDSPIAGRIAPTAKPTSKTRVAI